MILGHEKQICFLRRIFQSGKIPHAFLFSGEEGLGKKKVAIEFSSWVLNSSPTSHPDFFYLEPEKNKIQIEQVRSLIWRISLKPFKSNYKIAIIDSAHKMTLDAQNCFLKTLEEPKGDAIIILISEYPNLLLPTITSRCQEIKFFPIEKKIIENFLEKKGMERERIERILRISEGRAGVAITLSQDEGKLERLERLEKNLIKIEKADINLKFQYAKELADNFDFLEVLKIFAFHFRKNIFEQRARKILNEIQKIYSLALISNIDKRLALENLFLKI